MSQTTEDSAAERYALVVGNSAYSAGRLRNAGSDAEKIQGSLRQIGFKVLLLRDVNRQTLQEALSTFSETLRARQAVGFFYFSGHGAQFNGENYLIPVDERIERAVDVVRWGVSTQEVMDTLNAAGNPLNVVVLDACRNNPYPSQFRTATRGLVPVELPRASSVGALVAYSTSPGSLALDGDGDNSPYVTALSQYLVREDLRLIDVFMKTREAVELSTERKQVPWDRSSLRRPVWLGKVGWRPEAPPASPAFEPAPTVHLQKYEDRSRSLLIGAWTSVGVAIAGLGVAVPFSISSQRALERKYEILDSTEGLISRDVAVTHEKRAFRDAFVSFAGYATAGLAGIGAIVLFTLDYLENKAMEFSWAPVVTPAGVGVAGTWGVWP